MRRKNGMDRKHRAGLYLRLSKEDEAQGQSGSISNQRAILERYAQDQGWEVAGCYIDDGYSGLHFDRPGFQRLLSDIEAGLVNLVLTRISPGSVEIILIPAIIWSGIFPAGR